MRDIYNDAGTSNQVVDVLYSNVVALSGSGIHSFDVGYTAVVEGAHTIEVDIENEDSQSSNNEATRRVRPPWRGPLRAASPAMVAP